jgi:hypothetical protein
MDRILEPVKKFLEFNKVRRELSMLNPQTSYHYPSAISYQYPSHLSTPISFSSVGSMNIGNNNASRSLTNETNDKRITEGEPFIRQVYDRAAAWYQLRDWSSPSEYWWE